MNSSIGKTIIYFVVIGLIIAFLIYFYQSLVSNDLGDTLAEVTTKTTRTTIRDDIDLRLLEDSKFINLRENESEVSVFRAGRRNPFEPYD